MSAAEGNGATHAEGPWALPGGWTWAKLSAVSQLNPATAFEGIGQDEHVSFVPMAAVAEETGVIDSSTRRPARDVAKGYVRFKDGDVIFAKITPCMENGKVAPVVGLPTQYAAGSTEFHVFRPIAVEQRYLWYWLVSRAFRAQAQHQMSGSAGQLRVTVEFLRNAMLSLPALAEQRRIFARIDALFAEIAEGEAALAAARQGLETYRRALLKAAVTGELTADWREANKPTETGHDLLARIRGERAAKAPAKGRRRSAASSLEESSLPSLPEEWAWATLGELFEIYTGSTPPRSEPAFWKAEIPWVSSGEVAFCRIKSTRESISRDAVGDSTARVHPVGTVLLAMIGEGKTRGQCAVLDIRAANNQNAAAIRVSLTPVAPEYVYLVLEERYFRSRRESQGGNQPALNAGKVGEMPMPLPPLHEIAEILRRVSDALSAASDARAVLDAEAADAARLRQSILKAAFEGRLVALDPADEPAAAMLARLQGAEPRAARPIIRRRREPLAAS